MLMIQSNLPITSNNKVKSCRFFFLLGKTEKVSGLIAAGTNAKNRTTLQSYNRWDTFSNGVLPATSPCDRASLDDKCAKNLFLHTTKILLITDAGEGDKL